ncbi:MAG: helix-hairpin-helix domain-containing protein [Desulfuromonadales bacterium]|nr:helix-hairpin-helix domain-containing protein [Desulfuromonadales bacterium]
MSRPGIALLLLSLFAFLGYDIGRHVLSTQDVPAFFVENSPDVQVLLEGGWPQPGVYQFSDDLRPLDVIKMTGFSVAVARSDKLRQEPLLTNGEKLGIQVVDGTIVDYYRDWMSAAQRIALGIPLHPDRMTASDWEYLPGVGERLAAAIVKDRQNNGEFGRFEQLRRVKGIGPGRINSWGSFF